MKKALLLSFLIGWAVVGVCARATAQEQSCGTSNNTNFMIAGFDNYPPFSWIVDENAPFPERRIPDHQYHGFIYQLVEQALKDSGIQHVKHYYSEEKDGLKNAARAGKLDLIYTTYYADESKSGADYVFPAYFGNPFVVISRADKPLEIESVDGLRGMRGVGRNEEGVKPLIAGMLSSDTKIEWVDGARDAFQKLMNGEADFMIGSPYAAVAESKRFGIYDKIHIGRKPLRSVKLFAAFPKMSKCRWIKEKFTEKFNALAKDSEQKEKLLMEAIEQYLALHKDEPPLTF